MTLILLAEHPVGATPETEALLALMYLHAARFEARVDETGGLLLLERARSIALGSRADRRRAPSLQRSASGERFSRYHAEAAIAAEHCLSPSYAETRWDEITELYDALERMARSPLNTLNS